MDKSIALEKWSFLLKVDKGLIHFYYLQTNNIFKKYLNNPRPEKTLAPIPILNESVYTEWTETCQLKNWRPKLRFSILIDGSNQAWWLGFNIYCIEGFQFSIENIYRLAFSRCTGLSTSDSNHVNLWTYKNNILRNLDVWKKYLMQRPSTSQLVSQSDHFSNFVRDLFSIEVTDNFCNKNDINWGHPIPAPASPRLDPWVAPPPPADSGAGAVNTRPDIQAMFYEKHFYTVRIY